MSKRYCWIKKFKKIWSVRFWTYLSFYIEKLVRDFPSGPVVKSLHFHCSGWVFKPWLRKFHMPKGTVKKKKKRKKSERVFWDVNNTVYLLAGFNYLGKKQLRGPVKNLVCRSLEECFLLKSRRCFDISRWEGAMQNQEEYKEGSKHSK